MTGDRPFVPTKTSSRFFSAEAQLDAVVRAEAQVKARDAARLIPHTVQAPSPGAACRFRLARAAVVVTGFPGGYGEGLTRSGKGRDRVISPAGDLANALVVFERDPLMGTWAPVTHYPTSKSVTPPSPSTPELSERQAVIMPQLDDAFTCWYNADDIDFNNPDDVANRAEMVAMMLLDSGLERGRLVASMDGVLRRWGPAVIAAFCDAGYIAWDSEDAYEAMLHSIVSRIAAVVGNGGIGLRRLSLAEYLQMRALTGF